jgi:hypothetical protein
VISFIHIGEKKFNKLKNTKLKPQK